MFHTPASSAPSGNRIPLYVALFVAVAALAILGLRLTRNAPANEVQPTVAPANSSAQPFPSKAESEPKPVEPQNAESAPRGERLNG